MEFVFVVPRLDLFPQCTPHGFVPFGQGLSEESFHRSAVEHGYFVERRYAERTPALKQIIPYTVVIRDASVFCMRRTGRGGESRLHDKLTIGVGGHVNPVDLPPFDAASSAQPTDSRGSASDGVAPARTLEQHDPLPNAATRELHEELIVSAPAAGRSVGILNDDTNPVGAVHLGLVRVLNVDGPTEVRETDLLEGRFVPMPELEEMLRAGANFETWSALLLPHLDRLIPDYIST